MASLFHQMRSFCTSPIRNGAYGCDIQSQPTAPFLSFFTTSNIDNTFMDQGRNTIVDQIIDNYVMPKGNHLFKFGTDIQKVFAHTFNSAGINPLVQLNTNSNNQATGFTLP